MPIGYFDQNSNTAAGFFAPKLRDLRTILVDNGVIGLQSSMWIAFQAL